MISYKATQKIYFTLRGQGEEQVNISAFKEDFEAKPWPVCNRMNIKMLKKLIKINIEGHSIRKIQMLLSHKPSTIPSSLSKRFSGKGEKI